MSSPLLKTAKRALPEGHVATINPVIKNPVASKMMESFLFDSHHVESVAKTALRADGMMLQFAAAILKKNIGTVVAAIEQNPDAIQFADDTIKLDPKHAKLLLQKNGQTLKYLQTFQNDQEMVLIAISNSPSALQFADPTLLDDEQFVMQAISVSGKAYSYISERLRAKPYILNQALSSVFANPYNFPSINFLQKSIPQKLAAEIRAHLIQKRAKQDREWLFMFSDDVLHALNHLMKAELHEALKTNSLPFVSSAPTNRVARNPVSRL